MSSTLGQSRILIVDDEPANLGVMTHTLQSAGSRHPRRRARLIPGCQRNPSALTTSRREF
jgi:CheY-like chemotaxis protein